MDKTTIIEKDKAVTYIGIKEFQANVYRFLKELPIILTKYDIPFAKIIEFDEIDEEIEIENLKQEDEEVGEILDDL